MCTIFPNFPQFLLHSHHYAQILNTYPSILYLLPPGFTPFYHTFSMFLPFNPPPSPPTFSYYSPIFTNYNHIFPLFTLFPLFYVISPDMYHPPSHIFIIFPLSFTTQPYFSPIYHQFSAFFTPTPLSIFHFYCISLLFEACADKYLLRRHWTITLYDFWELHRTPNLETENTNFLAESQ